MTCDGEPFFWLADTAWELFHRLDHSEAEAYLSDRAAKGFTVIFAVVTGKIDTIGLHAANRQGHLPFDQANPSRPNEAYFAFVDWVVDRAAEHGLRMALLPCWGQSFVSGPSDDRAFDVPAARSIGKWLADRYGNRGVVWVLGGDVTPLWPAHANDPLAPLVDFRSVYDAFASGIAEGADPSPFITFHPCGGSPRGAALPRTSLYWADRSWLSMNMIQSSHFKAGPGRQGGGDHHLKPSPNALTFFWNATLGYEPIAEEFASSPVRPVVDGEPSYEDHPILGPDNFAPIGFWRARDIRRSLYQSLFAGAAGHSYGHFSVWNFYDPDRVGHQREGGYDRAFAGYKRSGWREALGAPGACQLAHAKRLLLSRPFFDRMPDQSILLSEAGLGEGHVAATRSCDGSYAMIYIPDGRAVRIDLAKIASEHRAAWWFDPCSAKASPASIIADEACEAEFVPPASGEHDDWILVLDDADRGFPLPGDMAAVQ